MEKDGGPSAQLQNKGPIEKPQALNEQESKKDVRDGDSEKPKVHSFASSHPQIKRGQSSTLSWSVSNADRVRIEPHVGKVGILGSRNISPSETTAYTIIATNETGESRHTQRIEVTQSVQQFVAGVLNN